VTMDLSCFKAYDLRGRVPDQLNPELAERIGRAYVEVTGAKKVIVGYDIRLSSREIADALSSGLMAAGADVFDIGLCGTELVYFATSHFQMDGGIMVTASHNPRDHNGMKMVGPDSRPISSDNGLNDIRDRVPEPFGNAPTQGRYEPLEVSTAYIDHLLGYIDSGSLKPMTIVVNAGNGGAGLIIDELEQHLPFDFVKVHHQADGHFPNGVPNPILEENRAATAEAVIEHGAAMGIAWDGDYDRCFFSRPIRPAAKSTARSMIPPRSLPPSRPSTARAPKVSATSTVPASNSTTGGSTCECPTPNRWFA